ncbi:MAG: cytochrome c biogenesis protein CcdA [Desulfococcus multivorans]|jgi:cytochrome c-type biogenesis protein|nr:cytochrome c biogenesis protein CcdA [Desulfococcus multivorans]
MFTQTISYSAAFLAGLLSFMMPCVFPLIPAYFTFITGYSLDELTHDSSAAVRKKVFLSTLAFVSGFSVLFIALGGLAASFGGLFAQHKDIIRIIGGVIIIILGIHLTGIFRIHFLEIDKRVQIQKKPLHFFGTFIVGMAFGAGWSSCTGPMLGSIIAMATTQETVWQGMVLLALYTLGLALPFLLISVFINYLLVFMRRIGRAVKYINPIAGALLIIVGVFLLGFNYFNALLASITH